MYEQPGEMMAHFRALEERVKQLEKDAAAAKTNEEKVKLVNEALEIVKSLGNMALIKMQRGDVV